MNKRQKRKKFKKKWGMYPEEYEQMSIRIFQDGLAKLPEVVREAVAIVNEGLKDMARKATEAAERLEKANEWREIMKNSYYITDEVDKSLLEHKGTRIDPEGYTYELYRDTANDVYFVDYGGKGNE